MNRIDMFIEQLENNRTTPNERRGFIGSLTKKEFIYFLKQDFSEDTQKSIATRSDLFEEYIHQTEKLVSQFTLNELKDILPKIKKQYVTIKNMFTEHLVRLIHNSEEEIDIKKIVEFKRRVEQRQITYEDIRSTLLKMKKEEFSVLITLDRQETSHNIESISDTDVRLDTMYNDHEIVIAEILEEYTEDEMVKLIPFLNDASKKIRAMFFKCFNEIKANEIFLTNAPKYSKDIYSYLLSPTQNNEKDKMIISILSNPNLYSLYDIRELRYLKSLISNKEIILDENSSIIETSEEEIIQEAAKYIANLRCRENKSITNGILQKLSASKLHNLLNEVNKGLLNVSEEPISYEEFIELTNMPLEKAVLFINECDELSEEEKNRLLRKVDTINLYLDMSIDEAATNVLHKYMRAVVYSESDKYPTFKYIYNDLLEMPYDKTFFDEMLEHFARSEFVAVLPECLNIFLAQLIEKTNAELNLDVKKEFVKGASFVFGHEKNNVNIGTYYSKDNKIRINTNSYTEIETNKTDTSRRAYLRKFLNRISLIEATFHELRHAYQEKVMKEIGSTRDLYFLMDKLIHHKTLLGGVYYKTNYEDESTEVDAELYSLVATASLLRIDWYTKNMYWQSVSKRAKELIKKRKSPQLRKKYFISDNGTQSIIDAFTNHFPPDAIQKLAKEYPMLDLITKDGFILNEEEIIERYMAVEQSLREDKLEEAEYERGLKILNFYRDYLRRIHNKKLKDKKFI